MASLIRLLVFGLALGAFAVGARAQTPPKANDVVDLEVVALSIADDGSVVYQVANRGTGGADRAFVVDIYVDGIRRDSITHGPLPPRSTQIVQSNRARLTACTAGTVRVVLDPQNGVREASERLAPPCSQPARPSQAGGAR